MRTHYCWFGGMCGLVAPEAEQFAVLQRVAAALRDRLSVMRVPQPPRHTASAIHFFSQPVPRGITLFGTTPVRLAHKQRIVHTHPERFKITPTPAAYSLVMLVHVLRPPRRPTVTQSDVNTLLAAPPPAPLRRHLTAPTAQRPALGVSPPRVPLIEIVRT